MAEFDVLVAGELNPDLILSDPDLRVRFSQQETLVENATLTIGSSSAIFACGAARLGLRVAFIGVVGDDLFGRFMLDALRERAIEVTPSLVDPALKTGFSVILSRGTDRAILTFAGAIPALHAEQVTDDLLHRARHLHVASYFLQTALQPGMPDLFTRARRIGLSTSLDTNWDPSGEWSGLDDVLTRTDIFLPNEAEALALTRAPTLAEAVADLSPQVPTLVVKQGSAGAMAARGNDRARAAAPPIPVADTVGAGDSFDAGFVYGVLNGWTLQRALELAVACGSLSVRAPGGVAGQPTLEEAMALVPGTDHG